MIVVGLDVSTKTGYCVVQELGNKLNVAALGEINFPKAKGIERVQLIGREVCEILIEHKPNLVVIEGYGFANKHTLVTLVEIGTLIRVRLEELGIPWGAAAPNMVKKFGAGTGSAKKEKMMLEVFKQWEVEGTDNEVDAFACAALGLYAMMPKMNPQIVGARREAAGDFRTINIRAIKG